MRFPAARPRKSCDSVPLEMLLHPPAAPSLALLTRQTEIVLVSPRLFPQGFFQYSFKRVLACSIVASLRWRFAVRWAHFTLLPKPRKLTQKLIKFAILLFSDGPSQSEGRQSRLRKSYLMQQHDWIQSRTLLT